MDEPSTGLDPASRKNLWDVVKEAKKESCIILTSECLLGRVMKRIIKIVSKNKHQM